MRSDPSGTGSRHSETKERTSDTTDGPALSSHSLYDVLDPFQASLGRFRLPSSDKTCPNWACAHRRGAKIHPQSGTTRPGKPPETPPTVPHAPPTPSTTRSTHFRRVSVASASPRATKPARIGHVHTAGGPKSTLKAVRHDQESPQRPPRWSHTLLPPPPRRARPISGESRSLPPPYE